MPYPAGHRAEVKRKIIDSARKLFNRYGFENVSLQQIMAGAGLTPGGFYSYFKSKSDLYAEVLGCFFTDPNWKSCWEGVHVDLSSTGVGPQVVRAYLSRQHYEDVENSCPMVALPTEENPPLEGRSQSVQSLSPGVRIAGARNELKYPRACVYKASLQVVGVVELGVPLPALRSPSCTVKARSCEFMSAIRLGTPVMAWTSE